MKQIQTCLDRVFAGEPPLKQKWRAHLGRATVCDNHRWLLLHHYHHLVLVVDLDTKEIIRQWWEKPADKRGLDAALAYLKKEGHL
jgi:hypothetical protein